MELHDFWFFLICVLWSGYFVLEGFDFGVGMLIAAPFYEWWAPGAVVLLFHGIPLATVLSMKILLLRRARGARSSPTPVP